MILKKPFVLLGVLNRPPLSSNCHLRCVLVRCSLLGLVYLTNGHTEQSLLSVTILSTKLADAANDSFYWKVVLIRPQESLSTAVPPPEGPAGVSEKTQVE